MNRMIDTSHKSLQKFQRVEGGKCGSVFQDLQASQGELMRSSLS